MFKTIKIFLFLIVILSFGIGQDFTKPDMIKGSKAVLFEFNGLSFLNVGSYKGGFGAKYYIGPNRAVRGALLFNRYSVDIPWTSQTEGNDGYEKATQFGIQAAAEIHVGSGRVDPYFGAGVEFIITRTKHADPSPDPQTEYKNFSLAGYSPGTGFHLFAIGGLEYFITKIISLSAEYQIGLEYLSMPDQETSTSGQTISTSGGSILEIGIQTAGFLTLAVYI